MSLLKLIFTIAVIFSSSFAFAVDKEGALQLAKDHAIYFKYNRAQNNQPTVVLLNGLIYPLKNWDAYFNKLSSLGYGVVQIAYSTQPESLRHLKGELPYFSKITMTTHGPKQIGLETSDLASDIMEVIDHLGLKQFHLLTLSYGSIVGSYIAENFSNRLQSVTLVAPAVLPSNRYLAYGESRHQFYVLQKKFNFNAFYDPDYFYDLELYQSMRLLVEPQKSTYDLNGVGFENFFSGVFQMARSAKYFDLKDFTGSRWPKTTLVIASLEETELQKDQFRFWKEKSKSASDSRLIFVDGAPHAIPGVFPDSMVEITDKIIKDQITSSQSTYQIEKSQWLEQCLISGITPCEEHSGSSDSTSGSLGSSK